MLVVTIRPAFVRRLANGATVALCNLVPPAVAIQVLSHDDSTIPAVFVSSLFVSVLFLSQWERAGQVWGRVSLRLNLIAVATASLLIIAFATFNGDEVHFSILAAGVFFSVVWGNVAVSGSVLSYLADRALIVFIVFRIAALGIWFVWVLAADVASVAVFFFGLGLSGLAPLILFFIARISLRARDAGVDVQAILMLGADFIRNQTWLAFFPAFAVSTSATQVLFWRQAIGVVSIMLASYRLARIDRHVAGFSTHDDMHRDVATMIVKVGVVGVVCLGVIGSVTVIARDSLLLVGGWLAVILSQEYRAYQVRWSALQNSLILSTTAVALLPQAMVVFVSVGIIQLHLAYLLFALAVGELASARVIAWKSLRKKELL